MRTFLLSVLLLAAPAAAQSIETVDGLAIPLADPSDIVKSSVGTQLTIHGSGFGGLTGTAKPVVFINSVALPKKRALKVVSFSDTDIVAEIKSAATGDFDLTVQPKGKGLAALTAAAVVRIVLPTFDLPNPSVAGPGTPITLTGVYGTETFGTKPGKVRVGGKPAKIVDWHKDSVVFDMPTKLANGIYVVEVTNKIGTATVDFGAIAGAPWCLQMDGSLFDVGGPDRFSCKIDGKKYKASGDVFSILAFYQVPPDVSVAQVGISATVQSGVPGRSVVMTIPVDLTTATFPVVIHGSADGKIETDVVEGFFTQTTWTTLHADPDANDWIIVLNGYVPNAETGGTQLAGSFSGSLVRTEGDLMPLAVEVTQGDFRVTVDPP